MKMQKLAVSVLAIALLAGLAGCGPQQATGSTPPASTPSDQQPTSSQPAEPSQSQEALPVMGDVIQYDPNQPVNGGQDIDIEFWYWTGAANLFQALVR